MPETRYDYYERGLRDLERAHKATSYEQQDAWFASAANMFIIANTLRQQEKDTNG